MTDTKLEHAIPRNILALASVASAKVTRYAMHGMLVSRAPDGACVATATDGRMLARVHYRDGGAGLGSGETIIPREACAAAAKIARACAKGDTPERETVRWSADGLTAFAKDRTRSVVPAPGVEGHYPPVDSVIPSTPSSVLRVTLDATLLATLAEALNAAVGRVGFGVVTLEINADKAARAPIVVRVSSDEAAEDVTGAIGVLMPAIDGTDKIPASPEKV